MEQIEITNPELLQLIGNKDSGYTYRKFRHLDWDENYLLYRNKVKVNRLTQRQTVILPLMKQTITTKMKDVDDMPLIYFQNLDNDKQAEVFQNAYWEHTLSPECNNMEVKDVIDKKQEMLFGRTFDQLQISNGKILMNIVETDDVLVDRYTDPADLDTARFLIHMHIYKPLSSLENNPDYDQDAVAELKKFYATQQGLMKAADNQSAFVDKNRKLANLGIDDAFEPTLGETYVELTMHFVFKEKDTWKNDGKTEEVEDQYMVFVEADQRQILMKKPLEKIIGTTKDNYWRSHLPYNSWAEDVEQQSFWSDGIADTIRPANKILNVWYSQLIENRTMRSFGMNYFDNTTDFVPPNIEPEPWGWIGLPGKPQEVFQKVEIPDLSESLEEMEFVIGMNDRATGAGATQQGVPSEKQITLGEVKLALTESKAINQGMSKFYTIVWKKRAEKFLKLIEAAPDKLDAVKIYKQGRNSNDMFSREIAPKEYTTPSGYKVKIWSQDEKDAEDIQQLQKLSAVRQMIPGNQKLEEVVERKTLEFAGLKPDEINDILNEQKEKRQMMMQQQQQMAQAGQAQMQQPAQLLQLPSQ